MTGAVGVTHPQHVEDGVIEAKLAAELSRIPVCDLDATASLGVLTGVALFALGDIAPGDTNRFDRRILRSKLGLAETDPILDFSQHRALAFDLYHGVGGESVSATLSAAASAGVDLIVELHDLWRCWDRVKNPLRASADTWPDDLQALATALAYFVWGTLLETSSMALPFEVVRQLETMPVSDDETTRTTLAEFAGLALSRLTQPEPITAEAAAELRLAAVRIGLLGPAMDPNVARSIVELAGKVLRAVTVLELRANGKLMPNEVIVLVRD
jgi:hypothetical protein